MITASNLFYNVSDTKMNIIIVPALSISGKLELLQALTMPVEILEILRSPVAVHLLWSH